MAKSFLLGSQRDARPIRSKSIFFRVTREEWEKIKDRAENYYGLKISDYIRTITKNEILGVKNENK